MNIEKLMNIVVKTDAEKNIQNPVVFRIFSWESWGPTQYSAWGQSSITKVQVPQRNERERVEFSSLTQALLGNWILVY